jgi:hypothetical protein
MMKTTLFVSALAAVLAISTSTFAQNYVAEAQAYGDAVQSTRTVAPIDRFTRSDLGYAGRVTVRHHKVR